MRNWSYVLALALVIGISNCTATQDGPRERWTEEQANTWYTQWGWLRGANFNPSTAINQLEFWQAETFDPETIDRELGWAEDIGFNFMRVYLHHVAWEQDPEGFKDRMEQYLEIADSHSIATMFVFFDDCWNPVYEAGTQPEPKPGIHNSGWIKDPGDLIHEEPELMSVLEDYVKDVMTHFSDDDRIVLWDLYNEPGNWGYGNKSMELLKNAFTWGREVNPDQPLTAGVWSPELKDLNTYQLANSDVISYHNYEPVEHHSTVIDSLLPYNRPIFCTEYMARTRNSTFQDIMPILKEHNIAAVNWGLVSGKSNTIYAWDTPMPDGEEPEVWFHDIFRRDGTVFSEEEIEFIKSMTGKE